MDGKIEIVEFNVSNEKSTGFTYLQGRWYCKPSVFENSHLNNHYNQINENTFEIDSFIKTFEFNPKDYNLF